jgi:hypothetical protein
MTGTVLRNNPKTQEWSGTYSNTYTPVRTRIDPESALILPWEQSRIHGIDPESVRSIRKVLILPWDQSGIDPESVRSIRKVHLYFCEIDPEHSNTYTPVMFNPEHSNTYTSNKTRNAINPEHSNTYTSNKTGNMITTSDYVSDYELQAKLLFASKSKIWIIDSLYLTKFNSEIEKIKRFSSLNKLFW